MRNITLSIDEDLLLAGREYARRHNISFNVLVGKLIEQTVVPHRDLWLADTFALMDRLELSAEGGRWARDELHRV